MPLIYDMDPSLPSPPLFCLVLFYVLLSQTASMKFPLFPDGISRESLNMPKELVQELIKRVTDEKEWKKLYLLFMGGAGTPHHRFGEGGLATGLDCDVSQVPLELIVDWGISNNVHFLASFIGELLKRGAPVLGSPGCDESPLQIAARRRNRELQEVLSKYDKVTSILM